MSRLLFIYFLICGLSCWSQDSKKDKLKKVDSLKNKLKEISVDTSRIKLLNSISGVYLNINEYDDAIEYAADALELAGKLNNKAGIARAYLNLGLSCKGKDQYEKAEEYVLKSLAIREQLKDQRNIAGCYSALGVIHRSKGNYYLAKSYQLKALEIREELKDSAEISGSLNSLGSVYFEMGDFPKSLEYYVKSLRLAEKLKNKTEIAANYNNIANIYKSQGNALKAIDYYTNAQKINEEIGNKKWLAVNISNIGNCLADLGKNEQAVENFLASLSIREELKDMAGLGTTYMNLSISSLNLKKYDEAISYGEKSLAIREDIGDKGGIASSLKSLGLVYSQKGQHKKGIELIEQAIELSKKLGADLNLEMCYRNISIVYEEMGDLKNALKFHKMYSDLKDSLLNQENNQQIAVLSTQFESEQKDNQIKLLNIEKEKEHALNEAERKKQNIIQLAGASILLLVLIVSIVMFTAYRRKKRDNIEIKLQKEIIENKSKEVEASITYARRIQSAILPSDNFISKVLPRSFVLYQPKDIVSGDFYWVEKVGNKLLIAVVDCTGHGVPGAMVSVVGNNALNRTIKEFKLTEPALILDKLNELVEETFEKSENDVKDGMDISLCSFDPDTLELLWAGANNPIWILGTEGMKEIKGDKQPIGKFIHRKPFNYHKIQLKKGDSFYLFSDGFADQFGGPKGKKFKNKQLMNILIASKNNSKTEQKQILLDSLQSWKGKLEQIDDICVIGVEV